MPGVDAAGFVSALPLSQMMAWGPITVEGRTPAPGEAFVNADIRVVGGDYFRAMQIPLLAGRLFDEHDTRDEPRVDRGRRGARARSSGRARIPLGKRIRSGGFDANATRPGSPSSASWAASSRTGSTPTHGSRSTTPHAQYPTRAR